MSMTVVIYINERPIIARSVRNTGKTDDQNRMVYHVDDGNTILHRPTDGAIALAIEVLANVVEP